ncbi:MAG: SnoaL-like domain-containing protein [Cyclobacteriaceae bacterium]
MAKLLEIISDLNDLVLQGKALEAFEKYYHDDVVMQENEKPPTVGKMANRALIKKFKASVTEFRSAKPLKVAIGQSISMVEWQYDYSHKDYGEVNYIQLSVQEWENGKILKENFYYNDIFRSKLQVKKAATLIVLFNLKEGTSEEDYERYAVEIDSPTVKSLASNHGFKILKGLYLFGSDASSPYQYIEVMNVSSFDELAVDIQKEEMRKMLKQFSAFADNPQLIVTKQIN